MPSFEEILKKPGSEIHPPQAYPVGTYHCIVDGPPEPGKSSQKQTDFLRFKLKILSPMEDVDRAKAAELQVVGKTISHDIYVPNEDSLWRLKDFLVNLGIEGLDNAKSPFEALAEAPNRTVLVKLKHEASQDGKRVFARVDSTAHV